MAHSFGNHRCADSSSDVIPAVLPREPSLPLHRPLPRTPGQERWDKKKAVEVIHRVCRTCLTFLLLTSDRSAEADGTAGGGRHVGRDERGEEEDGHGEEGVHPGALSLSYVPTAHHHIHPAAALAATVWDQRCEFRIAHIKGGKKRLLVTEYLHLFNRFSTTPPASL